MAFSETTEKELKDKPPKATTKKDGDKAKSDSKPKRTAKRAAKPGPKDLEGKLNEFIAVAGITTFTVLDPTDGIIIISRGEALAHSWAELAKVNPAVDRVLRRLVEGGVWGGVVASSLSIVIPIAQNHGVAQNVPTPFGISEKDVEKAKASDDTVAAMIEMMEATQAAAQAATPTPAAANSNG